MIFSGSQIKTMSKITLPLAIFHTADVLAQPKDIRMIYDLKSGEEWLKQLTPIENELYEFT